MQKSQIMLRGAQIIDFCFKSNFDGLVYHKGKWKTQSNSQFTQNCHLSVQCMSEFLGLENLLL